MRTRPSRQLPALALALWALLPARAWAAPVVASIASDTLESYQQAVAGFASATGGMELAEFNLQGDSKRIETVMAQIRAKEPALILALGPLAANAARRSFSDVPIVFCMVPNYEKYGLDGKNVTGVALSRPTEDQLASIKALLPAAKKVGVLYTPEYSQALVDQATAAAAAQGLALKAERLGKGRELAEAAHALAGSVDALWMIADRGTATVAASAALIDAARRAKVPLFALTEGQVREGALLAFTSSPVAIGTQAGRLAGRIVREKINPGALAVLPPQGLEAWVNLSTARALGLDAAFSARLLDHAGQKGLAVRVIP